MLSLLSIFCALHSRIKLMVTTHRYIFFQRNILLNAFLTPNFGSTLNFQTFFKKSKLLSKKSWDLIYTKTLKLKLWAEKLFFQLDKKIDQSFKFSQHTVFSYFQSQFHLSQLSHLSSKNKGSLIKSDVLCALEH